MRAYKEIYIDHSANAFGQMMDFAVNDYGLSGDEYLNMFITSGIAEQFERGNPKYIAGMSGIELAREAIRKVTGEFIQQIAEDRIYRTPEYWAGWALAQYQWNTAKSFISILRTLPFDDILKMYPTMHEADITKFYETADKIYTRNNPQTNLKRIRTAAGMSQSALAREAEVALRSIQMYEQRNKDINKASAITLVKMARVLGCSAEDLLEM